VLLIEEADRTLLHSPLKLIFYFANPRLSENSISVNYSVPNTYYI